MKSRLGQTCCEEHHRKKDYIDAEVLENMEELEETGLTLPEELDAIFETMELKSDFGLMKTVDT